MDIEKNLMDFIVSEFGAQHPGLSLGPEDNLFKEGIIDSMGALQLVNHIEQTFDLSISDADITVANFQSIAAIGKLVRGKLK